MLASASRLTLALIYLKLCPHAEHPLSKFLVAVSPQPGCRKGALLFLRAELPLQVIPLGQGWGSYSGLGWGSYSGQAGVVIRGAELPLPGQTSSAGCANLALYRRQ